MGTYPEAEQCGQVLGTDSSLVDILLEADSSLDTLDQERLSVSSSQAHGVQPVLQLAFVAHHQASDEYICWRGCRSVCGKCGKHSPEMTGTSSRAGSPRGWERQRSSEQRGAPHVHLTQLPKSETELRMDQVPGTAKLILYTFIKKKSRVSGYPPQIGRLAQRLRSNFSTRFRGRSAEPENHRQARNSLRVSEFQRPCRSVSQPVNNADKVRTRPC
ncbi:hypothetical protein CB1_000622003 [Camelus ferus]|nr:hypothetical protein CB1_000622003 [Camelus ferus]